MVLLEVEIDCQIRLYMVIFGCFRFDSRRASVGLLLEILSVNQCTNKSGYSRSRQSRQLRDLYYTF